jgi:DNA-binding MarR family transcriptional regulator
MPMTIARPAPAPAVPFGELNPVIHERVRLGITSLLAAVRELPFNDVKGALGLTDGNLSVHMRILEKHGYVAVDKTFVLRRPRTVLRLTRAGRRAFEDYLRVLERVTQTGRK